MNEPTYRCHVCQDHGFTSRTVSKRGDVCSVARFCEGTPVAPCPIGMPSESGYWAEKMKPFGARHVGDAAKARFLERTRLHIYGHELQSMVMRLMEKKSEQIAQALDGH